MADLQKLVRKTSNPSILKMQQRLHAEVVILGKQALEWKASCETRDAELLDLRVKLSAQEEKMRAFSQTAKFKAKHQFLEWNRQQVEPSVKVSCEYGVFEKAIELLVAAVADAEKGCK